jgi:hypothetical protein
LVGDWFVLKGLTWDTVEADPYIPPQIRGYFPEIKNLSVFSRLTNDVTGHSALDECPATALSVFSYVAN